MSNERIPVSPFRYLLCPSNALLVTCCDAEGRSNIITITWLIPVSIRPPLVGMSIGPTRHSYRLIQATGEFVINTAPYQISQQALFCGLRSGRDVDKFALTGLTPGEALRVHPPIIEECTAHLECRVLRDIEAGDHRFVIGEVLAAYARPGSLADGLYDLSRIHPLLHLGRNRFTSTLSESVEPPLPT